MPLEQAPIKIIAQEKPIKHGPITSVNTPKLETTRRALFRQPLALQWLEDGQLVKRREGERQAGRQEPNSSQILRRLN
jgi:hypothetical protein